jgi:ribonuclease T1
LSKALLFLAKCETLSPSKKLPGVPGRFKTIGVFLMVRVSSLKLVLTGLLLAAVSVYTLAPAKEVSAATTATAQTITVGELPAQGAKVYQLIRQGGPFSHEKDGVVFGNRERLLPAKKRGYYREYTVDTPGAGNRGVKRIVCGGPATTPDDCYYTADHYASFRKIVP